MEDMHDRVESRTDSSAVAFDFVDLPLLRGELEPVVVARFLNDTVERHRQRSGRGLCFVGIRFFLEDIAVFENAERDAGRNNAAGVLREQLVVRDRLIRDFDLLSEHAFRIADERDFDLFACFAAGRIDSQRTRERTDVQSIPAVAVSAVRAVANFDDVLTIRRGDDRCRRVLSDQRCVVGHSDFEPLHIEDADIRIEQSLPKPHAFNFDGNAFAFLRFDQVVVDIFVLHDSFDRDTL